MKVLVTGANGFVGAVVCARLHADGWPVTGAYRGGAALGSPWPMVAVGTVDGHTDWMPALRGAQVVVHLAGRAHVMRDVVVDALVEYRRVNVEGTVNLARQAARSGIRRLIFVSSIKVNGEQTRPNVPFTSADLPAPQDAYALSKWEAEQALLALSAQTGLEVVVVRPPLVYGPGVRGNFLALMRLLASGLPLPLGAVDNRRSLVALDNLVDLLVTLIAHPQAANRTLLVSDGEDLSTAELLRRIGRTLGKSARLLPVPVPVLRCAAGLLGWSERIGRLVDSLQVDLAQTRSLLGWSPPISPDQALRCTAFEFLRTRVR